MPKQKKISYLSIGIFRIQIDAFAFVGELCVLDYLNCAICLVKRVQRVNLSQINEMISFQNETSGAQKKIEREKAELSVKSNFDKICPFALQQVHYVSFDHSQVLFGFL
jgi:hypothetical protein